MSPTRACSSGPWIPSLPGSLPTGFAKSFVYCRYTTVLNTVLSRVKVSLSIAFRPFGTTFHVTGTAATQYSRTCAGAARSPAASDVSAPVPATTSAAPARAASASARGPDRRSLTA